MSGARKYFMARRLCALFGAAALALLAGEAALRLLAPFPDYTARTINSFPDAYHPLFGFSGIPRLDTMFVLPDFEHRIVNNSRGFREREIPYEAAGKRRIVVLGDSTAWGWGVEAEDRFSNRMEAMLPGWQVINLAQAGYSTDQELLVLETEGMKYHPEMVLLLFDRNDVVEGNNARVIDGMQPKPYFVEKGGGLALENVPAPYSAEYWGKKSALSRIYGRPGMPPAPPWSWEHVRRDLLPRSQLYNWLAFRLAHPIWKKTADRREEDRAALDRGMKLTEKLLLRIDARCREGGARLIIADIPSGYSPVLADYCRANRIPYIDLRPSLEGRLRPVAHRRVGHWNRHGHRLVAEAIVAYLDKKGFLKPAPHG